MRTTEHLKTRKTQNSTGIVITSKNAKDSNKKVQVLLILVYLVYFDVDNNRTSKDDVTQMEA